MAPRERERERERERGPEKRIPRGESSGGRPEKLIDRVREGSIVPENLLGALSAVGSDWRAPSVAIGAD